MSLIDWLVLVATIGSLIAYGVWKSRRRFLDPRTGDWSRDPADGKLRAGTGEALVAQLHEEGFITAELADQARALFAPDGDRAHEPLEDAVNLGREQAWTTEQGQTMWLGRMVMSGGDYAAVKYL